MTRCHDEAYENLTRGLNNADKRRLAEILEERTLRLKIDKAVSEERLRAQLDDAHKRPQRTMQPPYDAREDAVLLKQLPIATGNRAAVARELAGKGELSRRNATSIAARLAYHEVAVSGGGLIAKTLDEAMERLATQREALAGLADGIASPFRFEERAPTGAFMVPLGVIESIYEAPGFVDSTWIDEDDDDHDGPACEILGKGSTSISGAKGEYLAKIILEIIFSKDVDLVPQAGWGGADLHVLDPMPTASSSDAAPRPLVSALVEVKTTGAKIVCCKGAESAAITIKSVRPKQSTVLAVVLWHHAGFDLFVMPTAEFIDGAWTHMVRGSAAYGTQITKRTSVARAASCSSEDGKDGKDEAICMLLRQMLDKFDHLACYRRAGHAQRLRFWQGSEMSMPLWPLLVPSPWPVPPPLLLPVPMVPMVDELAQWLPAALQARLATCSSAQISLSNLVLLPAARQLHKLHVRFASALARVPKAKLLLGFHGTREANIEAIALDGLDPRRREAGCRGHGEYFAESISLALPYMQGARRLLVFALAVPESETGSGLVHRGDGMIVIDDVSQQLPVATVQVTHMGTLIKDTTRLMAAEAAKAEAEAAAAAAVAVRAAAAVAAEAAAAEAAAAEAAAAAAAAAAVAASQPQRSHAKHSEERTAATRTAFAASQESNKAKAALHAAKLKAPQPRHVCDHAGCAKSYTESSSLLKHKRDAHPAS